MYLREQMAEEMADKRIQILINAERSKRKKDEVMVDKEDEWVSSVLLHQEKVKVEVSILFVFIHNPNSF